MKINRMLEQKLYNEADPVALGKYHANLLAAIEAQFGKNSEVYDVVAKMDSKNVFYLSWNYSERFSFEYIYDGNVDQLERQQAVLDELERLGVI